MALKDPRDVAPPESVVADDELAQVQEVIRAFLGKYNFLHEWRIQKLVFYSEFLSLNRRGVRLTQAPFKRYHFGPYSETVTLALELMPGLAYAPDVTPDGRPTIRYSLSEDSQPPKLREDELSIIEEAHIATRGLTSGDLAEWSKATSVWRDCKHGEFLDFEGHLDQIGRDSPGDIHAYRRERKETKGRTARFANVDELLNSFE